MYSVNKINTLKLPPQKTILKIEEIIDGRKLNDFSSAIIELQKNTKLSVAEYYKSVFSKIIFKTESLSTGHSNPTNKNRIDIWLAEKISDDILLPLMLKLSLQPIDIKIWVLKWFFDLYEKYEQRSPWWVSDHYKVAFIKWENLEITLSQVFAMWAYYLTFWTDAQYVLKKEQIPQKQYIDINQLTESQLEIYWRGVAESLKMFYKQLEYFKKKTKLTMWFLDVHLKNDEKFHFFRITSFLFKKKVWTLESFKKDWFIDIIKNTHFEWKNNNSIDKKKVLDLFIKWNPNSNNI